jgi:hypothetical protein
MTYFHPVQPFPCAVLKDRFGYNEPLADEKLSSVRQSTGFGSRAEAPQGKNRHFTRSSAAVLRLHWDCAAHVQAD